MRVSRLARNTRGDAAESIGPVVVFLSNEKVPEATLDDLVKQTREAYDGLLEVGEDLTSFEIGDTVTITRWKQ